MSFALIPLALGLGFLCLALAPLFDTKLIFFDLLSHFPLQAALGAAGAFVLCLPWWKNVAVRWCLVVLLCACLGNGAWLYPYWNKFPKAGDLATPDLTIAQLNVQTSNRDFQATIGWLRRMKPDIFVAEEVDSGWFKAFSTLSAHFPYHVSHPRSDNFGLAVFSRFPIVHSQEIRLPVVPVPAYLLRLDVAGRAVRLAAIHTVPPRSQNLVTARNLYHRAECLTHVGDSQAVRSLTQCGEPMRFAMAAPIDLRNDFDSVSLRRLAKRTRDATQSRRLLALAEVYDGGSRTDASRIGGVGLQIIRDWVLRFNARGPDGLVDGKSPGAPSKLNADHRRALAEVVEAGPVPAVDGVVRWRRKDLARWLLETFAISLDETTVGRELKALGFAKISARPRHYAQNELAVEAFKKNFPAELAKIRARLPKGVEIELWWQDEARIGQKNKLTRRWARRGTRPRAPRDQRTEWAYIFGAICPAKGKGAGLVMPWCDTDAMAAHLIEISAAVDPGAHAVLIVDQAGWHLTPKLAIPDNITVLALPPRSPELNPVENVWQFMRDNWLSNRIFKSYEDIVALCCQAWNNLIDQPWKIMSLGMRKWAHGF